MTKWLEQIRRRARLLFRNAGLQRDIREELQFHLDMETDEHLRRGLSPEAARRAALLAFGGVDRTVERGRDAYGGRGLQDFLRTHYYAARSLRGTPIYTASIVLTLALGIGSVTALFSLVDGVLLRPLPFGDPERLELVGMRQPNAASVLAPLSPLDFGDLKERARGFADLAAFSPGEETLTDAGETPTRVSHALATANLFGLLGQAPALGRVFGAEDGETGAPSVAVLSHDFWLRHFGGDSATVGSSVRIGDESATVVGVLAPGVTVPADTDVWSNYTYGFLIGARQARWLRAVGRIAPDVSREQAHEDLAAIARELEQEYPGSNEGWGVMFRPLTDSLLGSVRPALLLLFGATTLILLLAVANVAGLILAHAEGRVREFSLRSALGAGRGHIARQLLAEASVLTLASLTVAIVFANLVVAGIKHLGPSDIPRLGEVSIDAGSMVFLAGAALFVTLALALIPAKTLLRVPAEGGLSGRATMGAHAGNRRLSEGLVAAQITISTVLLIGAGLFGISFVHLIREDPGFEPRHVVSLELGLPEARYESLSSISTFYNRLLDVTSRTPGIDGVTVSSTVPLGEPGDQRLPYTVVGRGSADAEDPPVAMYRKIGPGFFQLLSIPLVAGRDISELDREDQPGAAVINRAMAEQSWPGQDPIGQRLTITAGNFGPRSAILVREVEIVGVAGNVRYRGPGVEAEPSLYLGHQQAVFSGMKLLVRSAARPATVVPALREAIRRLDPELAMFEAVELEQLHATSIARERFTLLVLIAFSGSALALACVGLFGIVASSVARRSSEMAVREALGARPGEVFGRVVADSLRLVVASTGIGVLVAAGISRALEGMLYGVSAVDPWTFLATAGTVVLVGLVASGIPAWRALAIDPVAALRS